jgi:hypothetical protein
MSNLIAQEELIINLAHNARVGKINEQYGEMSLRGVMKGGYRSYDYRDRYLLKDVDDNRCVFCSSARLSKEYENLLKQNALKIYEDAELFFKKVE